MGSFSSSSFYSPLGQPTGSSQNQPKRKCGISVPLGDITNDPSAQTHSRRTCREETLSKVAANLEQTHEPRGDASKGGKIKAKVSLETTHCVVSSPSRGSFLIRAKNASTILFPKMYLGNFKKPLLFK